jgi:hypothetical protein
VSDSPKIRMTETAYLFAQARGQVGAARDAARGALGALGNTEAALVDNSHEVAQKIRQALILLGEAETLMLGMLALRQS